MRQRKRSEDLVPTHPFLSDPWIAEVRRIKADHVGDPTDQAGVTVNATIVNAPFDGGTLELCSTHGPVIGWEHGHLPEASFSMTIDYAVALELVLDRSSNGLELALAHGDIEIDGDFDAFRDWWHSRVGDDATRELENDVRAITG
jgi:hypothetical protein